MATASGFSPTAPGGPSLLSELNIVLLGNVRAGKSKVARALLQSQEVNEENEQNILYETVEGGRKIRVVDTPGWDEASKHCTSDTVKNEILKSVTLCPPGPNALILVLPVTTLASTSTSNEPMNACSHMELLSKRVWKHTMVVFCCIGDEDESIIKEHIRNAAKPLELCGHRHYVLRNAYSKTQRQELLKEIKTMVHDNHNEVFYLHDKEPEETIDEKPCGEDTEEKGVLRHRRASFESVRPTMDDESKKVDSLNQNTETTKSTQLLSYSNTPKAVVIISLGVVLSLIGSVAGATYGTVGSAVGVILGFVIGILLALFVSKIILNS